jgi:ribosome-binding protein aMBF1 (putative translation factor)
VITRSQIRNARKLLGWSRDRLAPKAGISTTYLRKFENGEGDLLAQEVDSLRVALESAGVEFTNGDAPGVRLRNDEL